MCVSAKKAGSQLSFRVSIGGLTHLLCCWIWFRWVPVVVENSFSFAYCSTHLASSWELLRLPSSLIAFRLDQVNHNAMIIKVFLFSVAFSIASTTSWADWISASWALLVSSPNNPHRCTTDWHLKKRWAPSSPLWLQTGQHVSIFIPRFTRLQRKGWLLWANR